MERVYSGGNSLSSGTTPIANYFYLVYSKHLIRGDSTLQHTFPRGQLHIRTLQLVRQRPRTVTFEMISRDTKLKIAWITSFCQDRNIDCSVSKVEALYIYLTGKKLELL